jgi:hypothetical protein
MKTFKSDHSYPITYMILMVSTKEDDYKLSDAFINAVARRDLKSKRGIYLKQNTINHNQIYACARGALFTCVATPEEMANNIDYEHLDEMTRAICQGIKGACDLISQEAAKDWHLNWRRDNILRHPEESEVTNYTMNWVDLCETLFESHHKSWTEIAEILMVYGK